MNRYESAYRDYTIQRGSGGGGGSADESTLYPQRPERSKSGRAGRVVRPGVKDTATTSDSSAESHLGFDGTTRMMIAQTNPGFSSTDEESFIHQPHLHRHHQISSRELSDRSGGERSNPDFLVANDAIQTYQRSPSLGSGSLSMDEERREERYRYGQHEENNRSTSVDHEVPEIYIPQPEFLTRMPTSELSQGSYRTYRTVPPYTEDATLRSKTSKRGGIVIESSRAPHPMCPNTRSCCCLMLLFNLGLLLICLGFVIVLQLNDPPFVWYLGVFMLVFGFVSLIIGLVFCAWMCREGSPDAPLPPNSELYWTHHWRKTIYLPESHGRVHETTVKTPIPEEEQYPYADESDSYSGGDGQPHQQRYHHHSNNTNHGRY
ncbi:uncharacterized protein LOC130690494 [Daphnia carinata]|uniref:uncharacterized protein LOC130690494 n=1 Tax=Daphnia carinata TaxID=120202 RepID=UPI00257D2903|nr:uncharacterized protein LOC130690494 [Daphnia carinata]